MPKKQIQARLAALLEATSDVVMVIEPVTGLILFCSGGDTNWVGADSVIGRKLSDIFSVEVTRSITSTARQAVETKTINLLHIQLRPEQSLHLREHGLAKATWIELRCHSTNDEVILVFRDISAQHQLERQVTSHAQRDPLTGAYNRRTLKPVLNQAVAQAQRYDGLCSLMIIDIDRFSRINEEYSWDFGDKVLQQLVILIHGMKRTSDFVVRYADDQLVMFMPETNNAQALAAGNRVRCLAKELAILGENTKSFQFSVSIGVAVLSGPEDGGNQMLKRAEEHLFIAKESGGNRVEGEE